MQNTLNIIETVLQVTNRGGKLVSRDDSTIILTDYDSIPTKLLQHIEEQCPQWNIEIVQADVSSSGFVLIFTRTTNNSFWQSSACMQLFLLMLLLTCIGLHFHARAII